MINVLFVVSHLYPQGPNKQLLYLCQNLDRNIINPQIVTTTQDNLKGALHDYFFVENIKIYDLKLSKLKSVIKANKKIQQIIDSNNIKIVLSYGFRSDFISASLNNVIKVTSVRNTLLLNWRIIWGPILGRLFGNINLHFIKKFDYVIACSSSVSNYLDTLSLSNVTIRNSINALALQDNISTIGNNVVELKNKSFITISSKLKGKNIEFLLHSFIKIELSNYDLLVAGYVDLKVQDKFKKYQNIKFLGHINNLHDFLYSCDYFISSSLHEGMPNAVLEALALGTPVVLSDIPPHEEVVFQKNDKIGEIFTNNSFTSLSGSIEKILKVDYIILSNKCRKSIIKNFSVEKMANEYEKLFLSIENKKALK